MAAPQISEIDLQKKELRRQMAERRNAASRDMEAALLHRLHNVIEAQSASVIAAVWPLPGEIDLRPLCFQLLKAGRRIGLPETLPKGHPLLFREWKEGVPMCEGRFGTSYPDGPEVIPDLVLVPFLAFDRAGYRLGYGGGYYDRTLAKLTVPAIGYGFSIQEMAALPAGPYDIPLSIIVTEKETIKTGFHNSKG
ncbi:5-formyltetrahydrofolate cyclo-ligase [Gluconobacter japonicus]|uniref:5-formyltetrahydrofolate cyclo-ligase n=1 Tax=Gluconobacter japonicus TaxID=376620 RepID=UPI000784CAB7|nr:5-formyltetrahydrofolate cyclo-ligase [Gluconobacter japonicus]KXV42262.1 5-formyltetrahydrofolate cyclo-ligase [Gluconobacter japonicus]